MKDCEDLMKYCQVYNDLKFEKLKKYKLNYLENSENTSKVVKNNKKIIIYQFFKLIKDLIFMSFMQVLVLGIFIILMERFNFYFLYVSTSGQIIYIIELAITFFYIFLFIDVITEFNFRIIDKKLLKKRKNKTSYKYSLSIIFIESLLQTIFFVIVNAVLISRGIFGVFIRDNNGSRVSVEFFYFLVFIAIFIVECLTEEIRIISNKLKIKSDET